MIGLNIILKKTKLWWIVLILIFIIFIGAAVLPQPVLRRFDTGSFTFYLNDQENSGVYSEDREFSEDVNKLNVDLNYGANRLKVGRIINKDDLYDVDIDYRGKMPAVYYNKTNNNADFRVEQAKKINMDNDFEKWKVNLTNRIPIDINVSAGVGILC